MGGEKEQCGDGRWLAKMHLHSFHANSSERIRQRALEKIRLRNWSDDRYPLKSWNRHSSHSPLSFPYSWEIKPIRMQLYSSILPFTCPSGLPSFPIPSSFCMNHLDSFLSAIINFLALKDRILFFICRWTSMKQLSALTTLRNILMLWKLTFLRSSDWGRSSFKFTNHRWRWQLLPHNSEAHGFDLEQRFCLIRKPSQPDSLRIYCIEAIIL